MFLVIVTWVHNDGPVACGEPIGLRAFQRHGAGVVLLQHPHAVDGRSDCTLWGLIADSVRGAVFVRILLNLRHAPSMQEPPDSFRRSAVPVWGGCASKVVVVTREVSAPACWKEVGCDGNGQR